MDTTVDAVTPQTRVKHFNNVRLSVVTPTNRPRDDMQQAQNRLATSLATHTT